MLTISVAGAVGSYYGFNALLNNDTRSSYILPFYGQVNVAASLGTETMLYIGIVNGIICGLLGGANAQILLLILEVKAWTARRSSAAIYVWCLVCSVLFVTLASNLSPGDSYAATVYGNGDAEVKQALNGNTYCGPNKGGNYVGPWYGLAKATATMLTYLSGICGGVFAPTFSAGGEIRRGAMRHDELKTFALGTATIIIPLSRGWSEATAIHRLLV